MDVRDWGCFHDGTIESIEGAVPGLVQVGMSIPYLRAQFPGPGSTFKVVLRDCTLFEYAEYDKAPVGDFEAIVKLAPEITYFSELSRPLAVECVMGTLTLAYDEASFFLDTGQPVSFAELSAASNAYWSAWERGIPGR